MCYRLGLQLMALLGQGGLLVEVGHCSLSASCPMCCATCSARPPGQAKLSGTEATETVSQSAYLALDCVGCSVSARKRWSARVLWFLKSRLHSRLRLENFCVERMLIGVSVSLSLIFVVKQSVPTESPVLPACCI